MSVACLPARTSDAVDFSRRFIPEQFTPLYHTPAYADLTVDERRRYNQLYATYFTEQIIFFETSLSESVLLTLANSPLPSPLAAAMREFLEEERGHTRMFRALNRACAPDLYAGGDFYFIRVPPSYARAFGWVARRVQFFPMVLWLMLLQEERSLFYSRAILRQKEDLEPHFVDVHRTHLADEAGHVRWDEDLLDQIWTACTPLLRRFNAELFRWMVGEFFNTPRRGGLRVVSHFADEFPELTPRLPELRKQLFDLSRSPQYHRSLYSREMVPRTFARFDKCPEFSLLGRTLHGYDRRHIEEPSGRHN
jgi:P-aminobenzoate N-oxygenase AurF